MPKRVGHIYEKMQDKATIRAALLAGARGKSNRWDVRDVLLDVDGHVDKLYDMICSGSYQPGTPRQKEIYDVSSQKARIIYVVPFFPDGVMHQLMVMVMQPILLRGMSHWSCASIPGRGGSRAASKVQKILRRDPKGSRYCCKMDIRHFYPSISHKKLIWALARKIKDKRFLKLVYEVLETCPQGLAIGYYLCQWLANFYLETLDRYIISLPGVNYMIRYMDDIVLFSSSKRQLHKARKQISAFLHDRLGLEMKRNWQVFPISSRMLDFVGYRFDYAHTILRRRNFLRFARQCRRAKKKLDAGKQLSFKLASGLLSRAGQLKHCDSHKIRVKYLDPVGIKNLKEAIRYESKRGQRSVGSVYA